LTTPLVLAATSVDIMEELLL
jgi:hypothetical protein